MFINSSSDTLFLFILSSDLHPFIPPNSRCLHARTDGRARTRAQYELPLVCVLQPYGFCCSSCSGQQVHVQKSYSPCMRIKGESVSHLPNLPLFSSTPPRPHRGAAAGEQRGGQRSRSETDLCCAIIGMNL